MTQDQFPQGLAALREAALDDLAATSDAELRSEAAEEALDVGSLAARLRASLRESAAAALRARMAESKARIQAGAKPAAATATPRPALERIKELIAELTLRDPRARLAFREGKAQSDEDWRTCYDDFVSMGLIEPEGDGH